MLPSRRDRRAHEAVAHRQPLGLRRHWVAAITSSPSAIFAAARDADRIGEYMMGLERQHAAMATYAEWVPEYESAAQMARA